MSTTKTSKYLHDKYVALNLINDDGSHTTTDGAFDPYIYPDSGHIPCCSQCQQDFDAFKRKPLNAAQIYVEFEHSPSCLWHDHFLKEVRAICPRAIVRRAAKSASATKAVPTKK
jgi:hypothetical protein